MKEIRLLLVSFFVLCVSTTNVVANSVTDETYPEAQAQVLETFEAIAESIILGAGQGDPDGEYINQLISFHAYGPKFVEFNDGKSFDSQGNEENERTLFGELLGDWDYDVHKFAAHELKVAVYYGNVANLTFISDFVLPIAGSDEPFVVNNLITLLFVKTKGEWKIVHEHHSPVSDDWEPPESE